MIEQRKREREREGEREGARTEQHKHSAISNTQHTQLRTPTETALGDLL
jgi:ribosome assembly protein YihI (activator of Der GTPase)